MPTCGYMQCAERAEFYGVSWSTLDANETYPSYCCPDHIGHLAIIRRVGYSVTNQPDGFPIHTERKPTTTDFDEHTRMWADEIIGRVDA